MLSRHATTLCGEPAFSPGRAGRGVGPGELRFIREARSRPRPLGWQAIAQQLGVSVDLVRRAADATYESPFAPVPAAAAAAELGPVSEAVRTLSLCAFSARCLRLFGQGAQQTCDVFVAVDDSQERVQRAIADLVRKGLISARSGKASSRTYELAPRGAEALAALRGRSELRPLGPRPLQYETFDRGATRFRFVCGGCDARAQVRAGLREARIRLRARGWVLSETDGQGHRCPACLEGPR